MKQFSTFSQRPSPQAPWDPSPEQDHVLAVPTVVLTALYDQMAPQLCPFEISKLDVFQKPRSRPPLPSKNHHGKNGKHQFPPVFVLNQQDPILPMETFVYIGWEQGQKAGRHLEN